jgi:SAM-dependent methyltransferase
MKWILKAALQKCLSPLPGGDELNYRMQRHLTHTLPRRGANMRLHIEQPAMHLRAFEAHGACEVGKATFFEFGAGWDLVGPLVYYALGVNRQILIDIRPHLRFELLQDTWSELGRQRAEIEQIAGTESRDLGSRAPDSIEALEQQFGITYLAPRDARDTGLPAASIDFISSTHTMEHIPAPDIDRILVELARLLGPEGVINCSLDLQDIYSYFDSSISPYNFLKFSDRAWGLANSSLHYQNRLRLRDYLQAFRRAGLEILDTDTEEPIETDRRQLEDLRLAPRFRSYSPAELAVKAATITARPVAP